MPQQNGLPLAARALHAQIAAMPDAIDVARHPDGVITYAIPVAPEALPGVRPAALLGAWQAARDGASAQHWGPPRLLRFSNGAGAAPLEIAIADPDANSWAEAVDIVAGLDTLHGLALCLRLLALVELLGRARWLDPLFSLEAEGVTLHPLLLEAAATLPLDAGARFDEAALRRLLSRSLPR